MKNSIKKFKYFVMMALLLLPVTVGMKASAEETEFIGPIDIKSIQKYVERDGWSWDPTKKELVLAGVNIDASLPYSYTENPDYTPGKKIQEIFDLPGGSTVIVKEGTVNCLKGRNYDGVCFGAGYKGIEEKAGITFKGGGTLQMDKSMFLIRIDGSLNIENVNMKMSKSANPVFVCKKEMKQADSDTSYYASADINITDSNIVLEDCYGGICTQGDYKEGDLEGNEVLATGSINIKNSTVDMQVAYGVDMQTCFVVRNGYLDVENSSLNLSSKKREAIVVWKQYAKNQKEDQLIRLRNTKVDGDVEIGVAHVVVGNSNVRAETFVNKGEKTEFDFRNGDPKETLRMFHNHHFTKGVNTLQLSAMLKKCVVTFQSEDGKVYETKNVYETNPIGELPVLENDKVKEYEFLGWSTKKNSEIVDVTEKTIVKGDMILYPVWGKPEAGDKGGNTADNNSNNNTNNNVSNNNTSNNSAFVEGLKQQQAEQIITSANTDKKDIAGSEFGKLMLKATGKKKAIQLKWKKVSGASEYVIYGSICGKKMQKLQTVSGSKKGYTFKGLKVGKYYKYMVVAYKKVGTDKEVITASKSAHATTLGGKNGNPTKITGTKKSVTIKVKKTSKIKASIKKTKKVKTHIAKLRYESSNPSIATVSSKGIIKGKKKGNCVVYVYAQNGVGAKIKVKVK